ncbi:MAG: hypothetical protein JXB32_04545 [Deltaproteobacteria bacterium]|nr:hypothetical protein [Deltaproteobacteria bacterium]
MSDPRSSRSRGPRDHCRRSHRLPSVLAALAVLCSACGDEGAPVPPDAPDAADAEVVPEVDDAVREADPGDASPSEAETSPDVVPDVPADVPPDDDSGTGDVVPDVVPDVPADDGGAVEEPIRVDGCFFTVETAGDKQRYDFGERGVAYRRIEIEYTTVHGGWREELYARGVLNHILSGLFRNASLSRERYILGHAAQIDASVAGLRPRSVFFARVDLEERPPGEGWTSYTSFRDACPWTVGEAYRVRMVLDAEARTQTLELSVGGTVVLTQVGDIPYFDVALTSNGWWLELGADESEYRDVSPVGWRFCDLAVRLERAP